MTQGNYVSEDTQNLIRRAQQTLGGVPVLDLTNWQSPRYMSNSSKIKSLAGSCHRVEVKTTVDGETSKCPILVDSSIVICPDAISPGTCPTDAVGYTCPADGTITTTTYVNMLAVFDMGSAQTGVQVTFKYLFNDVPTQTTVTVDTTLGINRVYAFDPNQQYAAGDSLVLYGAEVLA